MIRAVLFDAVGTLIYPHPSVAETYWSVGRRHGSRLTTSDVAARFREAVQVHFSSRGSSSVPPTNAAVERTRWRRIVTDVLVDVADSQTAFEQLWSHFAHADNWRLFPDVATAWGQLRKSDARLGVASNFDDRLDGICASLPPLNDADFIFHSAGVGYSKPDVRFYQSLCVELGLRPEQILFVGDHFDHDFTAPRDAGMLSLWLDRDNAAFEGAGSFASHQRICSLGDVASRLRELM